VPGKLIVRSAAASSAGMPWKSPSGLTDASDSTVVRAIPAPRMVPPKFSAIRGRPTRKVPGARSITAPGLVREAASSAAWSRRLSSPPIRNDCA
jgi:hypothetical protein